MADPHRPRRAIICGVALLLGAAWPAGCASPVKPPTGHYGLNLFFARRYDPKKDAAVVDQLEKIRGLHWVREEISLSDIAPAPDHRNFAKYDAAFRTLRAHGLYPLILIDDPPPWVKHDLTTHLPRLTLEIVRRYYRCCSHHYQILNEVNTSRFWGAPPDPVAYARVLRDTYTTVKKQFPDSFIVAAGLATSDVLYFDDFVRAGGLDGADAVAVHPYTYPLPLVGGEVSSFERIARLASDKPVWVTEIGWPTAGHPDGVSENEQNLFFRQSAIRLSLRGADMVFWYDYRNDGNDPASLEANFGLLRHDNSPKPAFAFFERLVGVRLRFGARFTPLSLTPVDDFTDGFNLRYHAEDLQKNNATLYKTPALLKGWKDLDNACLSMTIGATHDEGSGPGVQTDGILLGYEIEDQNKVILQGLVARITWLGEREVMTPVRLKTSPSSPLLTPPFTLKGLFLQASNLYKGRGLPEGVITVSALSTCQYNPFGL